MQCPKCFSIKTFYSDKDNSWHCNDCLYSFLESPIISELKKNISKNKESIEWYACELEKHQIESLNQGSVIEELQQQLAEKQKEIENLLHWKELALTKEEVQKVQDIKLAVKDLEIKKLRTDAKILYDQSHDIGHWYHVGLKNLIKQREENQKLKSAIEWQKKVISDREEENQRLKAQLDEAVKWLNKYKDYSNEHYPSELKQLDSFLNSISGKKEGK